MFPKYSDHVFSQCDTEQIITILSSDTFLFLLGCSHCPLTKSARTAREARAQRSLNFLNGSSWLAVVYCGNCICAASQEVELVSFTKATCTFCTCLINLHSPESSLSEILQSWSSQTSLPTTKTQCPYGTQVTCLKIRWFCCCSLSWM